MRRSDAFLYEREQKDYALSSIKLILARRQITTPRRQARSIVTNAPQIVCAADVRSLEVAGSSPTAAASLAAIDLEGHLIGLGQESLRHAQ